MSLDCGVFCSASWVKYELMLAATFSSRSPSQLGGERPLGNPAALAAAAMAEAIALLSPPLAIDGEATGAAPSSSASGALAGANGPPAPTVKNFNCVVALVAKVRVAPWSVELTRPLRSKSLTLVIVAGLVVPCGSLRALVSSVALTRKPLTSPAPESA